MLFRSACAGLEHAIPGQAHASRGGLPVGLPHALFVRRTGQRVPFLRLEAYMSRRGYKNNDAGWGSGGGFLGGSNWGGGGSSSSDSGGFGGFGGGGGGFDGGGSSGSW